MMPMGMATSRVTTYDVPISTMVLPKRREMASQTLLCWVTDSPRSGAEGSCGGNPHQLQIGLVNPVKNFQYWTRKGWSAPNRAMIAAFWAGVWLGRLMRNV